MRSTRKIIFLNHRPDEKFETLKRRLIGTSDVEQVNFEMNKPLVIEQDTLELYINDM